MSSASRAGILTGRYPQRFGFEFQMHHTSSNLFSFPPGKVEAISLGRFLPSLNILRITPGLTGERAQRANPVKPIVRFLRLYLYDHRDSAGDLGVVDGFSRCAMGTNTSVEGAADVRVSCHPAR